MTGFTVVLADAGGAALVGGKGASLGELVRAGLPVPDGFVVTAGAFAAAMGTVDPDGVLRAQLEALGAADTALLGRACAALRARIVETPLPDDVYAAIANAYAKLGTGDSGREILINTEVAVRSSATVEDSAEASFAGLQDSYLGVAGVPSVHDHVRRCWASLYNEESVAYRRRLGFREQGLPERGLPEQGLPEQGLAMAVVVQRMVAPRAAGVMFTRSPVTGDRSVVAIEGVWGLGSALVSGDVTPDSFIISKITGEITSRQVSPKIKIHTRLPNERVAPSDPAPAHAHGPGVTVEDTPAELRDAPCLTDAEIRALVDLARRVEAHFGAPQDIEWALLDAGEAGDAGDVSMSSATSGAPGPPEASGDPRIVLLQSRPETVWAAKERPPAGSPKPRPADHVLGLFGKPR